MCNKRSYSVSVHCNNCNVGGSVEIPFGKPVPYIMQCPNCGCNTACPNNLPKYPEPPFYPKRKKDYWLRDDYTAEKWMYKQPYNFDDPNRPTVTMCLN